MRRAVRLLAVLAACVVVSAGECNIGDLGSLLDRPGKITVTNVGLEPAVVAILVDDVKAYPTLVRGQATTVLTNTGGSYQVSVVMTAESAIAYKAELVELRRTVEKIINGSADSAEKTRAFVALAGIKSAIQRYESGSGASCSGRIKLAKDEAARVDATVQWVTQSGSGFWDLTCGST